MPGLSGGPMIRPGPSRPGSASASSFAVAALAVAAIGLLAGRCRGQAAQVDIKGAPGASFGRGALGAQPGDSGTANEAEDTTPRLGGVGGKAGVSVGRSGTAELIYQGRH